MRVLSVGGGSGGHVTPVLAVLNELSRRDPDLVAWFVCDKGFERQARGKMEQASITVPVFVISAGKLRRYHGESFLKRLFDIKTNTKNLLDTFKIVVGFFQSIRLIRRFKPDVIFAKGGFVCLPMGYAARVLGVPIVIHDSDTRPGLTNRLLGRFARYIATGSPIENYSYDPSRTVYTGVPIDSNFRPFSKEEQLAAKQDIGIADPSRPLIVVTGGGLGAQSINEGVVAAAPTLLANGYAIYHVTGLKHYGAVKGSAIEDPSYHISDFVYESMNRVLGAADIVVSRASATFLQELAALAKPVIVVPAGHLSDQVKNASVYQAADSVYVLDDMSVRDGKALLETIDMWRTHPDEAAAMAARFHAFARSDATEAVADLVIKAVNQQEPR